MNDIDFDDDFGCKQEENDKSAIEKVFKFKIFQECSLM